MNKDVSKDNVAVVTNNNEDSVLVTLADGSVARMSADLLSRIQPGVSSGDGQVDQTFVIMKEPSPTKDYSIPPVLSPTPHSPLLNTSRQQSLLGNKVPSTSAFKPPRMTRGTFGASSSATSLLREQVPRQPGSRVFKTGSLLCYFPEDEEAEFVGACSLYIYRLRQIRSGLIIDISKTLTDTVRGQPMNLTFADEAGVHKTYVIARVEEATTQNVIMDALDQARRWLKAATLHHGPVQPLLATLLILAFPEHVYKDYTYPNRVLKEPPLRIELTQGHER